MIKNMYNRLRGQKGYSHRHKMCPHCGKFVSEGDIKCSYCDGPIGHIHVSKHRATVKSDGNLETTYLLFGICIFFYILQALKSIDVMSLHIPGMEEKSMLSWYWSPNGWVALLMGSNYQPLTWGGDYWRLIQYMFLHGSLIHIGFNLYWLANLGPMVIRGFGIRRFWVLVLLTGIAGGFMSSLGFLIKLTHGPSIGISGAIMGLIGAMYGFFLCDGNQMAAARFKKMMIQINVFCLILTYVLGMPIDNLAHLGGMFTGIGLGIMMYRYASSKSLITFEWSSLFILIGVWVWGLTSVYFNITHIKEVAGL